MTSFNLCQFEVKENYSYHTYAFNSRDYEFGFVCINLAQEFVSHLAFECYDVFVDYTDALGMNAQTCHDLVNLPVGEKMTVDECIYVRLW